MNNGKKKKEENRRKPFCDNDDELEFDLDTGEDTDRDISEDNQDTEEAFKDCDGD